MKSPVGGSRPEPLAPFRDGSVVRRNLRKLAQHARAGWALLGSLWDEVRSNPTLVIIILWPWVLLAWRADRGG